MSIFRLQHTESKVSGFSLSIEDCCFAREEIYAVMGPNGAGKSTLMNLLALLDRPFSGEIEFDGKNVDYSKSERLLKQRRKIAYLMQHPYLFNMSVYNNIAYGLKIRGLPVKQINSKVNAIMDQLLLSHLAKQNAHTLSGGEAQRTALARTLVLDAEVYLLDEPTSSVDQQNIHVVEELILQRNKNSKATIVFTTHSSRQACRLSRNIISVLDGKINDMDNEKVKATAFKWM